jgi:hypothetical protein
MGMAELKLVNDKRLVNGYSVLLEPVFDLGKQPPLQIVKNHDYSIAFNFNQEAILQVGQIGFYLDPAAGSQLQGGLNII